MTVVSLERKSIDFPKKKKPTASCYGISDLDKYIALETSDYP